jgi:hypothetical protein
MLRMGQHIGATVGQCHALRAAFKQLQAQRSLKRIDFATERWLADPGIGCGGG